ncbi:hypothetical protein [Luteolibacter soli]|uniref:Heme exporter protein D n=1 Tax=Luteolibacter soli TaxID=3135280 RepID=A0ABU9AV48_9BACT
MARPPTFQVASVGIAYWLVILFYILAWTVLLTWRWQRMKKQKPPGNAEHHPRI